jgi:hypothetical protein
MFGKKEKMVKITEGEYEFLREKTRERNELYSKVRFLEWKLKVEKEKSKMTDERWNLYYDFIFHNWYPLEEADKQNELDYIRALMNRSPDAKRAFEYFLEQIKDREDEAKHRNKGEK